MSRERRKHVVYITKNSEYHCRDRECVAVRDRRSGEWLREHSALRGRLIGAVTAQGRLLRRMRIVVGMRLCLEGAGDEQLVMTSVVRNVGRPKKSATCAYAYQSWAGVIGA
ncbi:MAG: hypothetical protein KC503_06250 [Myxococcales bacterium]|nr:hypothetical protein [Myxococcales bacterium]